jgi:P-type conjugative transfer protein TrbJ
MQPQPNSIVVAACQHCTIVMLAAVSAHVRATLRPTDHPARQYPRCDGGRPSLCCVLLGMADDIAEGTKTLIAAALAALALIHAEPARAQGIPVIDVQSIAQEIMQVTQQVTQITNQMTQIQNQVTSLANEAQMLATLPMDFAADITGMMGELQGLLGQAQGLGFQVTNIVDQFRALYPEAYPANADIMAIAGQARQWIDEVRRAIEAAEQVQNQVFARAPTTQAQVSAAVSASAGAVGQTQAIQATNQILGEMAAQLQQMNALLVSLSRSVNATQAREAAVEAQHDAIHQRFMRDWGTGASYPIDPFQ